MGSERACEVISSCLSCCFPLHSCLWLPHSWFLAQNSHLGISPWPSLRRWCPGGSSFLISRILPCPSVSAVLWPASHTPCIVRRDRLQRPWISPAPLLSRGLMGLRNGIPYGGFPIRAKTLQTSVACSASGRWVACFQTRTCWRRPHSAVRCSWTSPSRPAPKLTSGLPCHLVAGFPKWPLVVSLLFGASDTLPLPCRWLDKPWWCPGRIRLVLRGCCPSCHRALKWT